MCGFTPDYRPQVGQTLFMAFMHEQPILVTVTGFHRDPRFTAEQIEFTACASGKKNSSSIDLYRFFPEAPIDSSYVYSVVQSFWDDRQLLELEEAYFFDPKSAFDHMAGLESGAIQSRELLDADDRTFRVEVNMV